MLCFLFIVKLIFFFEMHWSPSQFSNLHSNNHNLAILLKKSLITILLFGEERGERGVGGWGHDLNGEGGASHFKKKKKYILFKSFTTICSFLFSTLGTEWRHLLKQNIFSLSLSDFIFWRLPPPFSLRSNPSSSVKIFLSIPSPFSVCVRHCSSKCVLVPSLLTSELIPFRLLWNWNYSRCLWPSGLTLLLDSV